MSCKDCTNNCPQIISDCCIIYTGEDIPALGICTGDQICELQKIVVDKLLTVIDGTGITLSDVTLENCSFLADQFVGKDSTLVNLLQLLIDSQCTLKTLIDGLIEAPATFDTSCLTGLPEGADRDDILQAVITTLCSIKTTVDAIPSTYVKIDDINSYIESYISSVVVNNYYLNIPSKVALPYFGDMSNFDSTGKGLEARGFKNIFVCNGANGTPDLRGRAVIGAVRNIPGGSLDSDVNPALPANPNTDYSVGDKFGKSYITLTAANLPSHTHSLTDPGHSHGVKVKALDTEGGGRFGYVPNNNGDGTGAWTALTDLKQTNITINSAGNDQPHYNVQPSIAACWIMAIY
jgi:microcystin-dependent protein